MPKNQDEQGKSLDEQIAAYTDQILEGTSPPQIDSDCEVLKKLQEMANHLHLPIPDNREIERTARRLKAAVLDAYTKEFSSRGKTAAPKRVRWFSAKQIPGIGIAAAALIVLLIVIPLLPDSTVSLPGAAGGDGGLWPVFALIVFSAAGLVWLLRRGD